MRSPSHAVLLDRSYHPWLHGIALLTAIATFPLIFMGGLVTSHHAGMSVPDWPNVYGYNMFLFPPNKWVGGIFFEHTHRLMGTFVGFCATVLCICAWGPARHRGGRIAIAWITVVLLLLNALGTAAMAIYPAVFHLSAAERSAHDIISQGVVTAIGIIITATAAWLSRRREPRRWVCWVCTACLLAVCAQGLLGGLRVDLVNRPLAIVHACFAQATFCLIVLSAVITSRGWLCEKSEIRSTKSETNSKSKYQNHPRFGFRISNLFRISDFGFRISDTSQMAIDRSTRIRTVLVLACICVGVIVAQLIVAATMRHLGAGLAVPDIPFAYGHWLPPMTAGQVHAANHYRVWDLQPPLAPVTLGQIWLAYGHRIGALCVTIAIAAVVIAIVRSRQLVRDLVMPAGILVTLLIVQITLGLLTVYFRKPADVASAHVACGALVLVTAFVIAARAWRLYFLSRGYTIERVDQHEIIMSPSIS